MVIIEASTVVVSEVVVLVVLEVAGSNCSIRSSRIISGSRRSE